MGSETARKHSSGPHSRKPACPPEFGHPALNWLGHDLVELEFGLGSECWVHWTSVGFSCGLRLASAESGHAKKLLRECAKGEGDSLLAEIVLLRVGRRPLTVTDELTKVRTVFTNLLTEPPKEIQGALARLERGQQLAWWFRHSIAWGMKAGLDADSLFTGRLLAFLDRLPLNQRFISDRLVHIFRAGERPRRPALIEFFDYSYPVTSMERKTIVELAGKVLVELSRWGKTLAPPEWILCGFREGLLLSTRNAPLRKRLFAESTREGMQAVWSLFAEHVGPDATRWRPKQLVAEALAWLRKVHPSLVQPNCRAVEFERIRHLFDFAFWMGLAAGASDGSAR
jgi:hypothetical protein